MESSFYVETDNFRHNHKRKLKLAVYSRALISRMDDLHLLFGQTGWEVPSISQDLFYPYLAGLFDAEGQVLMRRLKDGNTKVAKIIIHSNNGISLAALMRRMLGDGVKCTLVERIRKNKPNPNYELRIFGTLGLWWFKEMISVYSHLTRKTMRLDEQYMPKPPDD